MYYDCVDIIQIFYLVFQGRKKFKEILYWTVFTPSEREGRCLLYALKILFKQHSPMLFMSVRTRTHLSQIFVLKKKKTFLFIRQFIELLTKKKK